MPNPLGPFRFLDQAGGDAAVELSRVVSFSSSWPESLPPYRDGGELRAVIEVELGDGSRAGYFPSSEPVSVLADRFAEACDAHRLAPWDRIGPPAAE